MKYVLFILFLKGWTLTYGQNEIAALLIQSDWKLINGNSYPYSDNGLPVHGFSVSNDSVLSLTYCYINFDYKIVSVNSDSLVLIHIQAQKNGEDLVFIKASCTKEHNQLNDSKFLSIKPLKYKVVIEDSVGIEAVIIDPYFNELILTEKNSAELDTFILNNRFNDTSMELIVVETLDGKFGVISKSEEVFLAPRFAEIKIDHRNTEK